MSRGEMGPGERWGMGRDGEWGQMGNGERWGMRRVGEWGEMREREEGKKERFLDISYHKTDRSGSLYFAHFFAAHFLDVRVQETFESSPRRSGSLAYSQPHSFVICITEPLLAVCSTVLTSGSCLANTNK